MILPPKNIMCLLSPHLLSACLLAGLLTVDSRAAETNTPAVKAVKTPSGPPSTDFSAFKIIADRNIFNPNRSSRAGRSRDESSRRPRVRVETFSLVGTLNSEEGLYCFFDGSGSQYRKVLQVGESIAGYKVLAIEQDGVKVEAAGKELRLEMGNLMRREDDGEWQWRARPEITAGQSSSSEAGGDASSAKEPGTSDSSASDPPASSGEENEVLKKLLRQREQEISK